MVRSHHCDHVIAGRLRSLHFDSSRSELRTRKVRARGYSPMPVTRRKVATGRLMLRRSRTSGLDPYLQAGDFTAQDAPVPEPTCIDHKLAAFNDRPPV